MAINITKFRGDSFYKTLAFKDQDEVAIDITGATIFFTIKEDPTDEDADAILQKKITVHTDPTAGLSEISLSAVQMDVVDVGQWYYDIQITLASGSVTTVMAGKFTVDQDVTISTI